MRRKRLFILKVCLIVYLLVSFSFFPSRLGVLSEEAERKTLLAVLGQIEEAGLPPGTKLVLKEKELRVGFKDGNGIYIFTPEDELERAALLSRYRDYAFKLIADHEHIVAYLNGRAPVHIIQAVQESTPQSGTMAGRRVLLKSLQLVEAPRFIEACMPFYTLLHFVTGLFILFVMPGRFILALPLIIFHPGHFNSLHLQYAYILLPAFWVVCAVVFWFKFPHK